MNKSLQKKIKIYSALSVFASLVANDTHADIIHTDVNYTGGYETYDIDIDGDGIIDFAIVPENSTLSTMGINVTIDQVSLSNNNNNNNFIIGANVETSGGFMSSYVVSNLSSGKYIYSSAASFIESGVLAGQRNVSGSFSSFPFNQSNDLGYFGDGTKHFVGIQFDIDGENHYGWLRFDDITSTGDKWTLVDMAYYDIADKGIEAGGVLSIEEFESFNYDVYSSNNSIFISSNSQSIFSNVDIIDMNGKTVLSQRINSTNQQIPYNLPSGIYVVRLFNNDKAITRKLNL